MQVNEMFTGSLVFIEEQAENELVSTKARLDELRDMFDRLLRMFIASQDDVSTTIIICKGGNRPPNMNQLSPYDSGGGDQISNGNCGGDRMEGGTGSSGGNGGNGGLQGSDMMMDDSNLNSGL